MSHRRVAFALVLVATACGGKSPAPATPAAERLAAAPAAHAPLAMAGEGYGGDAYGNPCGDGYGGDAYGDPCGGNGMMGGMIAGPADVPADPPELAAYLPEHVGAVGQQDAAAVYAVPVDGNPSAGKADAAVTLVVTFEFADPYSDRLRGTLDALEAKYGADLRIVWKNFIVHRNVAQAAALAGCAADKQGKFRPFMNALFAAGVGPGGNRRYDLEAVRALAGDQGLDLARLDRDLRSPACRDAVIRDQQTFEKIGQGAVPVSYVNGRMLQGAQPVEAFSTLIDEELAKAKAAFKKGTKRAKYYAGLVKTGRTAP